MRMKSFLIIFGCFLSCSLIISTPILPAIENQQIQDSIKLDIKNLINKKIIINKNNINIDFNSIIDLILLLLNFLTDLIDIFIAIMASLFDYISDYLIEIENLMNDINNPIFKIMILTVVYIYILLMFTVLILMVQFSGIVIILYLILTSLLPSDIESIKKYFKE